MSAQPHLFTPPAADGRLTDRQAFVLDLLNAEPAGLRSIDLGRELHLQFGCRHCSTTSTCQYAFTEGERVGKSLRARDLAIKRRTGRWQLLNPPKQPFDDLPEDF